MEKNELQAIAGVSEKLAEQLYETKFAMRTLGGEGVEPGDVIVLEGLPESMDEFKPEKEKDAVEEPKAIAYVNLIVSGDRSSLSLGSLVGTTKRQKYFDEKYKPEWLKGATIKNAFDFPHKGDEAVKFVAEHIGAKFQCIAKVENSGKNSNRTFYLWKKVK